MAMEVKDITLDDDLDLIIENGDFKLSLSDQQHILLILNTSVGNWKNAPLLGVGIQQYVSSSGQVDALKRAINIQLASDGYKVNDIIVRGQNESFEYYLDAIRS
jgi:hypothetical protein